MHYRTRGAVQRNDNSVRFFNAHLKKKKKLQQKRVCSLCVCSFVSVIVIVTAAAAGSFVPFLPTTVSENLKT